jgi:hypothetical protein
MFRSVFAVLTVTWVMLAIAHAQNASIYQPQGVQLQPILEVLDRAKLSGALELSAICNPGHIPGFPHFRTPLTTKTPPLQALHEILADTPGIKAMQGQDGKFRIIESGVSTDVLNIKISHLTFDVPLANGQMGVYSPGLALRIVSQASEVTAFMKAHAIEFPYSGTGGGVPGNLNGKWPPGQPRVTGSLDNVTVSDALDHILETFPGLWVYENCPKDGKQDCRIFFGFAYFRRIGSSKFFTYDWGLP